MDKNSITSSKTSLCIKVKQLQLEKHSETADLRQAAHSRVHGKNPSKKFLDPDGNPEHHQNVIVCSLSHYQHFLKTSSKSVHNFWSYLANKQTDKQSNKQTDKRRQKHNLLGGGSNNCHFVLDY